MSFHKHVHTASSHHYYYIVERFTPESSFINPLGLNPSSHSWASTGLLSVTIVLSFLERKWNHTFCVWFLSLSMMLLRFIRVVYIN